jgi:hypothetical protein
MADLRAVETGVQRLYYVAWAAIACIGLVLLGFNSWKVLSQREEYRQVIARCGAAPLSPQRHPTPMTGDPLRDQMSRKLDGLQEYQDAVARGCALPSPSEKEANRILLMSLPLGLAFLLGPYALMLVIRFVYRGFVPKQG